MNILKKQIITNGNRNPILDAMKGVGILLVVWGHVPSHGMVNHFGGFKMHLFMIISGYLAYSHDRSNDLIWLKNKVRRLLIPFIVWVIIQMYSVYKLDFEQCADFVRKVIQSPDASYWYLFTLFEMCVLLTACNYLIAKLKIERYDGIVYLLCVCLFNVLFWKVHFQYLGTYLLSLYLLSFLLGYYMHKHSLTVKFRRIIENRWLWMLVCLISVPLFLKFDPDKFTDIVYSYLPFGFGRTMFRASIRIIIPLLGVYFSYVFIRVLPKSITRIVGFIGGYTLEIYVLSNFFIREYGVNPWINSIINTIIAVSISMLIAVALESGLVNELLFGKYCGSEKK